MHSGRQLTQDPTSAVEFLNTCPVVVEPVKEFRVNGVRRFDTPFIFRLPAITRKFLWLTAIEVYKGLDHAIARGKERRLRDRLEEPPPHDLESFFRVSRSPWRLDASKDILKAHSRFPASFAARLGIRGRNGGGEERLWLCFGRLCQRLG